MGEHLWRHDLHLRYSSIPTGPCVHAVSLDLGGTVVLHTHDVSVARAEIAREILARRHCIVIGTTGMTRLCHFVTICRPQMGRHMYLQLDYR